MKVFENDPLVEVPFEDWPDLEEYLKKDWPRSILVSRWIQTRIEWTERNEQPNISRIFYPDGDIDNGMVFFGKIGKTTVHVTIYTQNYNLDKMKNAVLKTKYIDWNESPIIGLPVEHVQWYSEIMKTMGRNLKEDVPTYYYRLPKEKALALDIQCPPDVYVASLKSEHIREIDSIWPHRFDGSEHYLLDTIKFNFGHGVFSKKDDVLLSWVVKYEFGDIGVLQTKEEYKRKGYGLLVVKALSKKIAADGDEPFTFIVTDNIPSINLFKNLGFEYAGSYSWMK